MYIKDAMLVHATWATTLDTITEYKLIPTHKATI